VILVQLTLLRCCGTCDLYCCCCSNLQQTDEHSVFRWDTWTMEQCRQSAILEFVFSGYIFSVDLISYWLV